MEPRSQLQHDVHTDRTRPRGLPSADAPTSTVTLVEGSSFCVSDFDGSMQPHRADGLFVRDTRVISSWRLTVDGAAVEPLAVIPAEPYECLFVGRAAARAGHPEPTVIVERRRFVGQGMREDVTVRNFGPEAVGLDLTLAVDVDFADLFQVKEHRAVGTGDVGHRHVGSDLLFWVDRGASQRGVRVTAPGAHGTPHHLTFRIVVDPQDSWTTTIEVLPSLDQHEIAPVFPSDRPVESAQPAHRMRGWHDATPRIVAQNTVLSQALSTSERDLGALRITDPDHPDDDVVAAGAPWFMALFGRDSLLAGHMMLPFAPWLAVGTLRTLARLQGRSVDRLTDEEPGKILHEVRLGADLSLALGGDSVYYGSIDSTPLFVMLVGQALRWGVPAEDLRPLRDAVERACRWIVEYGDRDGDGFVEYQRGSDRGLENQGWKDSFDALVDDEGRPAVAPIALAEVQGYCYAAFLARAELAEAWGDGGAEEWRTRAEELKRRFHEAFWIEDLDFYAMALDRHKRPVRVVSSNIGHCLWSGIVDDAFADRVVARLMSAEMFTGFGVRTRSAASPAFNPASYHNGSVWPHDTVLTAAGMARYGFRDEALRVAEALLDALEAFGGQLPELFCGFDRAEKPVPVPYPTSCSPQAWAAAAPFEILRLALGLEADVPRGEIRLRPAPSTIGAVSIARLPLGSARVDIEASPQGVEVEGLPAELRHAGDLDSAAGTV
ncbi:amylo-alpha-1,6-glucosidase [Aeromicrobium camelliae]|uniref:Amylo-alpha-1,6-glucosidase n=1 Tax=Aeromicrobium camelliae TaxID=1538144 RepID=A0A3N6WMP1_9ACTN|nr:glycogen debranching N-terminal domain-containing protein [Aeromicrobium camelliae]RQN08709.1 amylo-alpha-1,6-glucosidase [Aeromicrobium camelliae]